MDLQRLQHHVRRDDRGVQQGYQPFEKGSAGRSIGKAHCSVFVLGHYVHPHHESLPNLLSVILFSTFSYTSRCIFDLFSWLVMPAPMSNGVFGASSLKKVAVGT